MAAKDNLQLQLFDPKTVTSAEVPELGYVTQGTKQYAQQQGMKWSPPNPQLQVDSERGYAQYLAYRDAMKKPEDPSIRSSYEAMREHVNKQYDFMTSPVEKGGLGIKHQVTTEDPYPSVKELHEDLGKRTIKTLSTKTTGGHAFFTDEENDKFRAVHDVFGHLTVNRGFSRHGEEAAFRSHIQMFPKEAHAALTSETRGQNSYLNFSPERDFPDQSNKLIKLPSWTEQSGRLRQRRSVRKGQAPEQLQLF